MSVIITVFRDCAFEPIFFGQNNRVVGMLRQLGEKIPFSKKLDYQLETYSLTPTSGGLECSFLIANSPKLPLVLAFAFDRADEWYELYLKARELISEHGTYDPAAHFRDLEEHNEHIGTCLHTYREKLGDEKIGYPDYEFFLVDVEHGGKSTHLILMKFIKPSKK